MSPNEAPIQTDYDACLKATPYIDSDHETVRKIVDNLKIKSLPKLNQAIKFFYFVRDEIRYNPYVPMLSPGDYTASGILNRGTGYCTQKAVALAALSRCAGIPCRLCFADIRNYLVPENLLELMGTNLFTYHGYVEFFLDDKWIKATPAFDQGLCLKHGFIPVDFDGSTDAVFHELDRQGRKHIEYERRIGCYADLPFEDIFKAFETVYGRANPGLMESWKTMKPGDAQGSNR